jgi:hypothetical protein
MCYDVISCPSCREWLDEFNASSHVCKVDKVETLLERPIELVVKKRARNK